MKYAIAKRKKRIKKKAEAKQAIADAEAICSRTNSSRTQAAQGSRLTAEGGASQATQDSYAGSDGS